MTPKSLSDREASPCHSQAGRWPSGPEAVDGEPDDHHAKEKTGEYQTILRQGDSLRRRLCQVHLSGKVFEHYLVFAVGTLEARRPPPRVQA